MKKINIKTLEKILKDGMCAGYYCKKLDKSTKYYIVKDNKLAGHFQLSLDKTEIEKIQLKKGHFEEIGEYLVQHTEELCYFEACEYFYSREEVKEYILSNDKEGLEAVIKALKESIEELKKNKDNEKNFDTKLLRREKNLRKREAQLAHFTHSPKEEATASQVEQQATEQDNNKEENKMIVTSKKMHTLGIDPTPVKEETILNSLEDFQVEHKDSNFYLISKVGKEMEESYVFHMQHPQDLQKDFIKMHVVTQQMEAMIDDIRIGSTEVILAEGKAVRLFMGKYMAQLEKQKQEVEKKEKEFEERYEDTFAFIVHSTHAPKATAKVEEEKPSTKTETKALTTLKGMGLDIEATPYSETEKGGTRYNILNKDGINVGFYVEKKGKKAFFKIVRKEEEQFDIEKYNKQKELERKLNISIRENHKETEQEIRRQIKDLENEKTEQKTEDKTEQKTEVKFDSIDRAAKVVKVVTGKSLSREEVEAMTLEDFYKMMEEEEQEQETEVEEVEVVEQTLEAQLAHAKKVFQAHIEETKHAEEIEKINDYIRQFKDRKELYLEQASYELSKHKNRKSFNHLKSRAATMDNEIKKAKNKLNKIKDLTEQDEILF